MADNSAELPVFTIQRDWLDGLRSDSRCWLRFDSAGERIDTMVTTGEGHVLDVENKDITCVWQGNTTIIAAYKKHAGPQRSTAFHAAQRTISSLHSGAVECMAVTDDATVGYSFGRDGKLCAWMVDTAAIVKQFDGHINDVYSTAVLPSGQLMISGGADFQMRLWTLADGKCVKTYTGHKKCSSIDCLIDIRVDITRVLPIGVGKCLASCSADGRLLIFSASSCEILLDIGCRALITDMRVEEGRVTAVGEEGAIDVHVNQVDADLQGWLAAVTTDDGRCLLIDLSSGACLLSYANPAAFTSCAILQSTPPVVVAGTVDGDLCVAGRVVPTANKSSVTQMCALGGTCFAAGYGDGSITVYSLDDTLAIKPRCHSLTGSDLSAITSLQFKTNRLFASCKDGRVRVYDASWAD